MKKISLLSSAFCCLLLLVCSCSRSDSVSLYNVLDFGAKGDGKTNEASYIQNAIDKCNEGGGGTVVFPAGKTFLSGPIELKSNVNLHFEPNSTLLASPDESLYTESAFKENRGEGMMWLWGKDLENISITGQGNIDGNGVAFMGEEKGDYFDLKPVTDFDPRPHLLTLINCRNIRIKDLKIGNGAYWTIHLIGCEDAAISDITLLNNLKVRNGDGIDLDHSKKIRISGCYIESGDDGICLKNRREYEEYGPCRDIVVSNCMLTSRSCAIKIGSENMDSIDNVLFTNCIITDSNRGIGIQNRDEGTVSNITFSNMTVECHLYSDIWWGKSEPIYVTSFPRASINHKDANWRFPKGATEGRCGEINDIRFYNIVCKAENGIYIDCDQPGKIRNLTFSNVDVDIIKTTDYDRGVFDRRPCLGEGFIEAPHTSLYADNVDGLCIKELKIMGAEAPVFRNCTNISDK